MAYPFESQGTDFGHAVVAAKEGKRIARAGWGGMFAFMRPADTLPSAILGNVKSLPASVKEFLINEDKGSFDFSAYFCLYVPSSTSIVNGWAASQLDVQATDWVVLD